MQPKSLGFVGRSLHRMKRWMYRGDRPGRLAKAMNWLSAKQFSAGVLAPSHAVTVELRGRKSGRTISFPVAVADYAGQRYLVSMLGEHANWVSNLRAADGHAVIVHKGRQPVRLVAVPPSQRAPIIRRYLALAPGARPHIPVDRHAPLEEFERIAAQFPVFQIVDDDSAAV